MPSNALAVGAGPLARWNFLEFSRCRLFVDGAGDLLLADRPFPAHGTVYDFFLRAGGGVSLRVSDSYWVESAFRFAHVPLSSVGYNFFLRAGSGASFRLHPAYWLDASVRWGHITTGFGPGGNNYLPWSGRGVSLALRHTLH